MKKYSFIFAVCSILCLTATRAYSQRHNFELAFQASGMSDGDSCLVSLTAVNGLTRWALDDNDKLPTQSHTSFSGKFYKIDDKPKVWGLDAPDDGNKDLAWGKYEVDFQCSPDGFSRSFYLDLRDADWTQGLGYINPDITITYYPDNGDNYKLMAQISGESPEYITSNEVVEVWELGDKVQNQEDLLVPVTATNNWSGGNIKMAGTTYSASHTLNWGWTTTHAIEAITPQTVDDIIHTFSQWSDAVGTNQRNVTIDDSHNSYSFTANFTSKPVTPDNFSGTTYNNHPKLSWDALTGDAIQGYKVYRDYNKGGWQFVTSVTPKSEDDWVDNNYTTSGSPLYITKYRITSYTSSAQSDYTSIYTTYTRLARGDKSSGKESNQLFDDTMNCYNYPDPFNPETTIAYSLPDAGRITVKIFDIRGREVCALLQDVNQQAGEHTVFWNGKDHLSQDVASGMYFYQIKFKDRYSIKKMLLIQ